MAGNEFHIKKDAIRAKIKARLVDKDGVTVTLTGATVTFSMRDQRTKVNKVAAAAVTILSAAPPVVTTDPNVEYPWVAGDVDTVGTYEAEWKVVYADATDQIFPDNTYNIIHVLESME